MTRLTGSLLLLALLAGARLDAQAIVQPGARVRVYNISTGQAIRTGRLVSAHGDTVLIEAGLVRPYPLVLDPQLQLQAPTGDSHGHALAGLALGAAGGAAIGAIIGSATYRAPSCNNQELFCFDFGRGFSTAGGATLGFVGGGLLGLIIGSSIRHTEWGPARAAASHDAAVSLVPAHHGVDVGLRLRF